MSLPAVEDRPVLRFLGGLLGNQVRAELRGWWPEPERGTLHGGVYVCVGRRARVTDRTCMSLCAPVSPCEPW